MPPAIAPERTLPDMTTALTTTIPAPAPVAPPVARLRRMRYEPVPGGRAGPPRSRALPVPPPPVTDHRDRDAVHAALAGVVRLALEVFDGRRPAGHLTRHFHAAPLRYWSVATNQRRTQRRARTPARVHRIVLCLPGVDAAELAAVCAIDGRFRALAARFERRDPAGRWRCTAVRLG